MSQAVAIKPSRLWDDVREGEELPPFSIDITTTIIVAGAIGTRDFYPLHHDRTFAQAQGFKDIVLNLLTAGGYAGRYVTDWSGPESEFKKMTQRVGIPCYPGDKLVWKGKVLSKRVENGEHLADVEYVGRIGDKVYCNGVITLAMPTKASSK